MGENDAHLRTLEGLLGCDIGLRGNQLTLDGSSAEVERGEALVSELLALLKSGQGLDSSTLKLAASLSADAGNGHSYFRDSPLVSSDLLATLRYELPPAQRGLVQDPDTGIWEFPPDYLARLQGSIVSADPDLARRTRDLAATSADER